jgi:DNA-binding beta-propeller fold protein YncE
MTFGRTGDQLDLWIADPGAKRAPGLKYDYPPGDRKGQTVRLDGQGAIVQSITAPNLPIYDDGVYSSTAVAVFDDDSGGNGDVWVADGYGQSYLHRYDRDGNLIASFNGEESEAGRLNTPHGLMVDTRKSEPELYVADRANNRIVVLDMEGQFKRVINSGVLSTPYAFATDDDILAVSELRARASMLDSNDQLIGYLSANEIACDRPGWPNALDEGGSFVRPSDEELVDGNFNSPHGIAIDGSGNMYVPEWLIDGRFVKSQKV